MQDLITNYLGSGLVIAVVGIAAIVGYGYLPEDLKTRLKDAIAIWRKFRKK